LGIPDLGITTLEDVLIDISRITNVCNLPLMVDIDTGFGPSAFNINRTVRSLIKAGAAALHIEDQVGAKRCGQGRRQTMWPPAGKRSGCQRRNGKSPKSRRRCPHR